MYNATIHDNNNDNEQRDLSIASDTWDDGRAVASLGICHWERRGFMRQDKLYDDDNDAHDT